MMPAPVPGFVTAGDALRKALAKNGTLTERLIAYRDSLGNAESKALIADALDELTYAPWRESRLLEALKGLNVSGDNIVGGTVDTLTIRVSVAAVRAAAEAVAQAEKRR